MVGSGCCIAGSWHEVDTSRVVWLQESRSSLWGDWRSRTAPQGASIELGDVSHEAHSLICDVVVLLCW